MKLKEGINEFNLELHVMSMAEQRIIHPKSFDDYGHKGIHFRFRDYQQEQVLFLFPSNIIFEDPIITLKL